MSMFEHCDGDDKSIHCIEYFLRWANAPAEENKE